MKLSILMPVYNEEARLEQALKLVYLGDLETCFKLMPVELYRSLNIKSAGFGMEAEVTGKLLRRGVRPYEVSITYHARTREEGKKITWRDGVEALWILTRERLRQPPSRRGSATA